jgi:hypothetical protein
MRPPERTFEDTSRAYLRDTGIRCELMSWYTEVIRIYALERTARDTSGPLCAWQCCTRARRRLSSRHARLSTRPRACFRRVTGRICCRRRLRQDCIAANLRAVQCEGLYANMLSGAWSSMCSDPGACMQTPPGCVDDDAVGRANRVLTGDKSHVKARPRSKCAIEQNA